MGKKNDQVDKIIMDVIYDFTHLWVDGFGWENTIFSPSDFDRVSVMPTKAQDGSDMFMAYNFHKEKVEIRKFKGKSFRK